MSSRAVRVDTCSAASPTDSAAVSATRRHAVTRGSRSGAAESNSDSGKEDLWDISRIIIRCWTAVTPPLQTCGVRDGEGTGAVGSRPHRQRRPGGEIVKREERNTRLGLRLHPAAQPAEVRPPRIHHHHHRLCCCGDRCDVLGSPPPRHPPPTSAGVQEVGCGRMGIPAVVRVLQKN